MSAGRMANQMRLQALMAAGKLGAPKHGLVTSYDGSAGAYRVKVMLQPEGVETGWLPITPLMAGAGYGVYVGPSQNDQAVVLFQEGDKEAGFCIGFLGSDEDPAPAVASGEIHLIAKAGQLVKMLADGTITAQADANTSVKLAPGGVITSKGSWTHTGTLHTTQDITCDTTVTATTDVVGGGKHLKTHTHNIQHVQGGSATLPTDPPT